MSRPRKRSTASLLVPAWLRSWARRHAYSFLSSLGSISRQPLASFMTIAMLAITLSLPAGLYVTLDNIGRAGHGWERLDSISIFMDESQGREKAIQLASLVSTWPTVSAVDLISPEKGMAELAGRLQLDDVAGEIASNPLPWVLEVTLAAGEDVRLVATRLEDVEGVDQVIVDLQWLDRLQAIVALLRKMAALLAVLFALAVMFVIGNTVRMENQQQTPGNSRAGADWSHGRLCAAPFSVFGPVVRPGRRGVGLAADRTGFAAAGRAGRAPERELRRYFCALFITGRGCGTVCRRQRSAGYNWRLAGRGTTPQEHSSRVNLAIAVDLWLFLVQNCWLRLEGRMMTGA